MMHVATLTYTPDEDIKVHEEGAIRLICRAFQSHESGLPEWLKNSADAYARGDAPEHKRISVVILDNGRRDASSSISCLDFMGMTSDVIEDNFRIWADPDAARRGSKTTGIQGGHGNGGKCYMTQMFDEYALIHTAKRGKGNRYGVVAGSIRFGYIPNRQRGRDFSVENLQKELEKTLAQFKCPLDILPKSALEALKATDGFTLISGLGPKGYGKKIPVDHLVENLREHPQMIQTLGICRVYIIANGRLINDGKELALPEIPPMDGAEKPRTIPIPEILKDPVSEQQVSTTNEGSLPQGQIILRTSDVSMRWKRKGRHVVNYKAQSGHIGYDPVSDLDVQSSYRDRIYGECFLEALEPYKQNERGPLAKSPLTRAVKCFMSQQIELYAKEFEARDRRQYDREAKNEISKINEALDRWKNRFLNELMQGLWGPGQDGQPPPPPPLPAGKPARLELSLSHRKAGLGVAFRPTLKFFDENGRRIRTVPFKWISEDNNVVMVDEDLMIINTFAHGETGVYAETLHGKLRSNKVFLEVVRIQDIRLSVNVVEVPVGNRQKIEAVCRLANGDETSDIYLEWTENDPNIARVSASGLVFGFSPGETEVIAGDDSYLAKTPAIVKVVPGQAGGKGSDRGRGFPIVLVSGIDPDPHTNEDVTFSKEDPPIWQRPQDVDRNIWWINSSAPLARLYLDESKDYGYQSREWRMYHIERYIDVIVQIALTHGPTDKESLSVNEWIMRWGSQVVEIQAAAAADLSGFIETGQLPRE
ncbi:MAG: hypothetical protein HY717_03105 [Planctomycetes bacterium]|nr:hypothetical protein [Planctomycetota bacterium]